MAESQKNHARDIFTLSKRLEEILHDKFELIATRAAKGEIEPAEIDALVDESRDALVMPVAQFVKRTSSRKPI
jgi:hypothetical protein